MSQRSFIIDYLVHGGGYASNATKELYSEERRLQTWLDVEAALVQAQAELGLIPQAEAQEIQSKAKIENFDLRELKKKTEITKHSLMPLIDALEAQCSSKCSSYIHMGATTQDIQDTAMAIEMREVLGLMRGKLCEILEQILDLIGKHGDIVMTGRTHSMPASPITFGLKMAGWADEVLRMIERIDEALPRICVVQLFGSVGSMAGFGKEAPQLIQRFADKLRLNVPNTSWHASRDRVADFVYLLALTSSGFGRFADELRTLNRVEIREVIMGFQKGEIGSSCMPHKRNPEDAEQVIVLARLARAQVGLALEAMILEHERDYRGTRIEWPTMMQVAHYSYHAAEMFSKILKTIHINEDRLTKNADEMSQFLFVERLLGHLTKKIGRSAAYEIVYDLAQISQDSNENIKAHARNHKKLLQHVTMDELERIFSVEGFVGQGKDITKNVVLKIKKFLQMKSNNSKIKAA